MSRDYYFFVEYYIDNGWKCLPALVEKAKGYNSAQPLFIIKYRSHRSKIFFAEDALLAMRTDLPIGSISPEVQMRVNEDDFYWNSFSELMIDDWASTTVLVSGEVELRYAQIFKNGSELFPSEDLLLAGMDKLDVEALRDYAAASFLVSESVDWRYKFVHQDEDSLVYVTWKKSVDEFVGKSIVKKIKSVVDEYGADNLRFIVSWG
jgi:hypothetical protein